MTQIGDVVLVEAEASKLGSPVNEPGFAAPLWLTVKDVTGAARCALLPAEAASVWRPLDAARS